VIAVHASRAVPSSSLFRCRRRPRRRDLPRHRRRQARSPFTARPFKGDLSFLGAGTTGLAISERRYAMKRGQPPRRKTTTAGYFGLEPKKVTR